MNTGSGDQTNHFHMAPQQRRERVLAGLPPEPSGFVGRLAEVAQLLDALNPDPNPDADAGGAGAVVVCAVGGLAGVGKSALAVHAARQAVAEGWFHGAAFVNLRGYEAQSAAVQPGEAVPLLLRALGVDDALPPTPDEQLALYHAALTHLAAQGRRMLLVLDNVADPTQIDGLLPGDDAHRVVITSRQTLGSLRARLLDLDVLDETDAMELLTVALREARPGDPRVAQVDQLARVASACGRLPLALQIAAALLKSSPRRAVSSLADELTDERARLEVLRFPDTALRPGVRAALELSRRLLTAAQVRMLRLLALDPGPSVETGAAAALADLPSAQASHLLYALEGAHLLASDVSGQRWGMHDLVRAYGLELLDAPDDSQEQAQARERLLKYYLSAADAADDHLRALAGQQVPARFSGRAQALAWFDANRANLLAAVALAADHQRPQIAVDLALRLSEYLSWRRYFEDWIATRAPALDAARVVGDRRSEGDVLTTLGLALLEVRRSEEAIDAHERAASVYRETGDRHREGVAVNNLGLALREVRRFEEAIDAHERAASVYRETGDRHGEGGALSNLGLALREVRRFEEAIDALEQAASIFREAGDRHREGIALNNLSVTLRDVRRFDEAIDVHEQAASIFREAGDRHGEGVALGNLGVDLTEVRRFEEAIDIHQQAASIFREVGDRHREGIALNNLGLALREVRRFEEAIDIHQQAASIFREAGDRRREGVALTNLGEVLQDVQRFEECRGAWQQARGLFELVGADDDVARVSTMLEQLP